MVVLAVISILIGAGLGVRFKVLILLPAIVFAWLAILSGGLAYSSGLSSILAALAIATAGLQIGYLAGGLILCYATLPPGSGRVWTRHRAVSGSR